MAYADFVTAMMAFFMLMWLLNATTEKQRKGIADYFNPTIPVNRISGGGDGSFGGDSVLTDQTLAQNGTGAASAVPTDENKARGEAGDAASEAAVLEKIEQALTARTGESMTMERVMRHVVTKVTDEGLVIEIFDVEDQGLFLPDSAMPDRQLTEIAGVLVEVLNLASNQVAVNGPFTAMTLLIEIHAHDQWLAESLSDLDEFDPTGVVAEDVADGEFAFALDGLGDDALSGLLCDGSRGRNNKRDLLANKAHARLGENFAMAPVRR